MCPTLTVDNSPDLLVTYGEPISNVNHGMTLSVKVSNSFDIIVGQLGRAIARASLGIWMCFAPDSPLGRAVKHVISLSSQKQVVGIDTARIITVMAYVQSIRNRATVTNVVNAVRNASAVFFSRLATHFPIARILFLPLPFPAARLFVNDVVNKGFAATVAENVPHRLSRKLCSGGFGSVSDFGFLPASTMAEAIENIFVRSHFANLLDDKGPHGLAALLSRQHPLEPMRAVITKEPHYGLRRLDNWDCSTELEIAQLSTA